MTNLDYKIQEFRNNFCPFRYLDIKRTIEIANEVGEDSDWAFEKIEEYKNKFDIKDYEDIDPIFCLYYTILEKVRKELEELTKIDIVNDFDNSINIYSNYLDTRYDLSSDAIKELIDFLDKYKIDVKECSNFVNFFFKKIEIY